MSVEPVVIPIESLRTPGEKLLLFFPDALKQRTNVVGAEDVFVLDREGKKHLEGFLHFTRLLFDAIDRLLHPIDNAFLTPAPPAWMSARQQIGSLFRHLVHQGN